MQLVNGQPGAEIPVNDRSVLYGQGVFETVVVVARRPRLWRQHRERLELGCQRLGLPLDADALESDVALICDQFVHADFILRVNQTMGVGGRGYADPATPEGHRIVTTHALPQHDPALWRDGIQLGLCELRLSQQPALAGLKHNNRLEQILARAEWQPDWQEAVLLDPQDRVIEATQSNIFAVSDNGILITPALTHCGVAGVMREFILSELATQLNLTIDVCEIDLPMLVSANELFVSNSVIGVWPVKQFGDRRYNDHPVTKNILSYLLNHEVIPPY